MSETSKPLTPNEGFKLSSDFLRTGIAEAIADTTSGSVDAREQQLLKFHGLTLQDDRDLRTERKKQGLDKAWSFMIRLRLPGGKIDPKQWLQIDALADSYANGTLKLTTRQAIQLHGVLKSDVKATLQALDAAALHCLGGSGDAVRNVMSCVNPSQSPLHQEVYDLAKHLSVELEPQTQAYREIWLNEERVQFGDNEEPLFGKTYLPRKFKLAVALPPENDVDIYTQDLGFVAIVENGAIIGYNVLVGGGSGYAYGNPNSFPRIADIIGFIQPDEVLEVAKAVVKIHRDYGDRTDRKTARLRYVLAKYGVEWFKDRLKEYRQKDIDAPKSFSFHQNTDVFEAKSDSIIIPVEGGRVRSSLREAIREIAKIHNGVFYITANQNFIIADIAEDKKPLIDSIIIKYGVNQPISGIRRDSSACTALPYCPMAFSNSERLLPDVISGLEVILKELDLESLPITTRMTGCPNGCTRPSVAELSFVAKGPNKYNIWLGGSRIGNRLSYLFKESVNADDLSDSLKPVFIEFAKTRRDEQGFGDWAFENSDRLLSQFV